MVSCSPSSPFLASQKHHDGACRQQPSENSLVDWMGYTNTSGMSHCIPEETFGGLYHPVDAPSSSAASSRDLVTPPAPDIPSSTSSTYCNLNLNRLPKPSVPLFPHVASKLQDEPFRVDDLLSGVIEELDEDDFFAGLPPVDDLGRPIVDGAVTPSSVTSSDEDGGVFISPPPRKRLRCVSGGYSSPASSSFSSSATASDADDSSSSSGTKFRSYQAQQWWDKYDDLLAFQKEHGHSQVPHGYPPNPQLARWCKRQRYQYKLQQDGKSSTITKERVEALNRLGFIWDTHGNLWFERFEELRQHFKVHGTSNIPAVYPPNPKLAIWVKCQRRQHRLLAQGRPSNITQERIKLLDTLDFVWEIRKTSK